MWEELQVWMRITASMKSDDWKNLVIAGKIVSVDWVLCIDKDTKSSLEDRWIFTPISELSNIVVEAIEEWDEATS